MVNLIAHTRRCDITVAQTLLTQLNSFYTQYPDNDEITVLIAKGLYNMIPNTGSNNLAISKPHLTQLELLHIKYPDNFEITLTLAQGLVNLIASADSNNVTTAQTLLTQLESLHTQYHSNLEITVLFVKGLCCLLYYHQEKLSPESITLYFGEVQQLANEHLDSVEILSIVVMIIEKRDINEERVLILPKYLFHLITNYFKNKKWDDGFKYYNEIINLYTKNIENEALAGLTFCACQVALFTSIQLQNLKHAYSIRGNMEFIANKFDKNEVLQDAWQKTLITLDKYPIDFLSRFK